MLIGIVGKPNAGKSTFLNAATMAGAKVADYPFTTIDPNLGKGHVQRPCVCQQLKVKDNPKNSICENGLRFAPVDLLDVAGLVPGAHEGKGMGNKFLNDLSRADVLLHVVDFSGSTNDRGEVEKPGSYDPVNDIKFLEDEIAYWLKGIIERQDWAKFARTAQMNKTPAMAAMGERLSGIGVTDAHTQVALRKANLVDKRVHEWNDDMLLSFSRELQRVSKPIIIMANKLDKEEGRKNFARISAMPEYKGHVFPCSALAEYNLRMLAKNGIIEYTPGAKDFKILKPEKLGDKEKAALARIKTEIMDVYGSTGVQAALDKAVLEVLDYIYVYPVADQNKFTDNDGRVLPDVFLVKRNSRLIDVAGKIHTDLAKSFIHGINARDKRRLGEDYEVQPDDVIKIVSAK
ncbi:MAG: redox-regulated ATPase YchF [Candidatus Lokiarchaeota archaeon]|nr:redox-regulated ATPase YchF [Candidatus Lokiarchaeota archaeon]